MRLSVMFAIVTGAAMLPRVLLAVYAPQAGGDEATYLLVAENIYQNVCVSLSDPASGICVPDWGGNHFPGLPAFIALGYLVFGHTPLAAMQLQILVTTAAILWLTRATLNYSGSLGVSVSVGLMAALSPLQVAWSRFLLTEALFLAVAIWLLAEILLSLANQRLRIAPIGLALACATFVRYDGILFAVPVAVVGFAIHTPRDAIRKGVVIALLVAVPVAAWSLRGVAHGLSVVPPAVRIADGEPAPSGYAKWRRTWEVTSYHTAAAQYPVNTQLYRGIVIDPSAFRRASGADADRGRVESLLAQLRQVERQPFPQSVDQEFLALAAERKAESPARYWLWLPLRRAVHMWFDPFASMGWPAELGPGVVLERDGAAGNRGGLVAAALANPVAAGIKALASGYRAALLLSLIVLAVLVARGPPGPATVPVWAATSLAAARTGFFVAMLAVQSRYVVGVVPFIETAVILGIAARLAERRTRA